VLSRFIAHSSDEIVLLTTLGLALLVAGVAERLQLSAAVGAFLVGITLSGTVAKRTHRLMHPLTDWFAAIFFLFFGLGIDLNALPAVVVPALALVLVTSLTKLLTGWLSTRQVDLAPCHRLCAGVTLVARGEFSLVMAGMGVAAGLEPQLGALAAAYVLFSAFLGTILTRVIQPLLVRGKQDEPLVAHVEKVHAPSH
jgi:CPA2 family monovalent cation:H+ antiporter-2